MELVLNPNDNVIGRGGLSVERKTADGLLTKEIYHPRGRFYEGHVTSDSESHVAVRETGETGELVSCKHSVIQYYTVFGFAYFTLSLVDKTRAIFPSSEKQNQNQS